MPGVILAIPSVVVVVICIDRRRYANGLVTLDSLVSPVNAQHQGATPIVVAFALPLLLPYVALSLYPVSLTPIVILAPVFALPDTHMATLAPSTVYVAVS